MDLKVAVMIDLCTKDLREYLELKNENMKDTEVNTEILNYIERKRASNDSQVKAMEVDNCEQVKEYEDNSWEEWYDPSEYPSNQDELNYMGKGGYKGKGKGKGKSGYPYFSYNKGKGKGEGAQGNKGEWMKGDTGTGKGEKGES